MWRKYATRTKGRIITTQTVSLFLAILTVMANTWVVGILLLVTGRRWIPGCRSLLDRIRESLSVSGLWFAWVVSVVATAGSLYYSEVAHFVPCKLCWYQRIFMYPLVIVLGFAAIRRDFSVRPYVASLAAVGSVIAIYHYQLERFPSQSSAFCDVEAPCTLTWVWKFHYISIPFMALSAFALIITLMLLSKAESEPQSADTE